MGISETKKQIVIDNYFKKTCNVNTSIKEAFTKGFEVGLTKAVFPEARLKADMAAILDKLRAEIEDTGAYEQEANGKTEFMEGITYCLNIIDKYKAESNK